LTTVPTSLTSLKVKSAIAIRQNKVVLIVSPEKNRIDPGYHANDELKSMDGMVTSENNRSDVIGENEKRRRITIG
jgi:hypothetical protein